MSVNSNVKSIRSQVVVDSMPPPTGALDSQVIVDLMPPPTGGLAMPFKRSRRDLNKLKVPELKALCFESAIPNSNLNKNQLIEAIIAANNESSHDRVPLDYVLQGDRNHNDRVPLDYVLQDDRNQELDESLSSTSIGSKRKDRPPVEVMPSNMVSMDLIRTLMDKMEEISKRLPVVPPVDISPVKICLTTDLLESLSLEKLSSILAALTGSSSFSSELKRSAFEDRLRNLVVFRSLVYDSGFVVAPSENSCSIESLDRDQITTVYRKVARIFGNNSKLRLTASSAVSPVDMATFADPFAIPRGDRTHIVENVTVFRAFLNFAFCFGPTDPLQVAKTFSFRSFLGNPKIVDIKSIHDALFRFGKYYDHLFSTDNLFHNLIMIPYTQVRDIDHGLGFFKWL